MTSEGSAPAAPVRSSSRPPSPVHASRINSPELPVPSRSSSPEDRLEGLKLGNYLKAAVLKMGRDERRKKIAELKKCSDYELVREDNILRNQQLMEGLGLNEDIFRGMRPKSKKKPHTARSKPTDDDDDDFNGDNDEDDVAHVEGPGGTRGRRSARLTTSSTRDEASDSISIPDPTSPYVHPMPLEGVTDNEQADDNVGSTAPVTDSHTTLEETHTAGGLHTFLVSRFPRCTLIGAQAIEATWAIPNNTSTVIDKVILCTRGTAKDILTHVNRAGWPGWLIKYFDYLSCSDLGRCWGVAVALWTDLERVHGFRSSVSFSFSFSSLAHS